MSKILDRPEWRHRPFPELVRLAWPIAVSMLSYSIMTLVDTLFVGRLGAFALAGVGLGGVAAFTVLCFGFGLLRGVKVLVSQAVGAGRPEMAQVWLGAGLVFAAVLSVVMVASGELLAQGVRHLAATDAAGDAASSYLTVRMLGTPLVMAFVVLREHRYGLGDSQSPMVATVAANVVNVALDTVFILVLEWGVVGAAASSVVAQGVELVVLAWRGREKLRPARVRLAHLRELWSVGVPTGLQFWMEVGSFAILTALIARMGELDMAAHQIALQVMHFSFLPTAALGEAASVMAGQAVGAGRIRLVRRVARLALIGAVAYTGLCTAVLLFGGELIARAFTDDPALSRAVVGLFGIAMLFQVADGAAVVARGVLRGTGDVRFPAVAGVACAWLCTPPLAWLLGVELGLGARGGWIGLSLEIALAAGLFWWRLERLGWLGWARRMRAGLAAAPVVA
ncbi:MAG: MATE family efflux transporter [Sandaracinaceae bacterium]|nr:MATE family efflux transporter [Sandaracinaceae bacterium]